MIAEDISVMYIGTYSFMWILFALEPYFGYITLIKKSLVVMALIRANQS